MKMDSMSLNGRQFQMSDLHNMNKKLVFVFFIAILLVISGCKGGLSIGSGKNTVTDVDVRKGTNGLVMKFIKNAPPDKVFEGTTFPIALQLNNKGSSNVKDGILVFVFEDDFVSAAKTDKEKGIELEGKSVFNPDGEEKFETINAKAGTLGAQSEMQASRIRATACYKYQTTVGISICLDPDVYGIKKAKKACTVKDVSLRSGQGAPVTITKIETRMLPDSDLGETGVKPHFIIHLENKGNGEVITSDKYEKACTSQALAYEDFNRIKIAVTLSKDTELDCNVGVDDKTYGVRLRGKKDIVRCTARVSIDTNTDAYTTQLKIVLDYGYTTTISKDITIEKILRY